MLIVHPPNNPGQRHNSLCSFDQIGISCADATEVLDVSLCSFDQIGMSCADATEVLDVAIKSFKAI